MTTMSAWDATLLSKSVKSCVGERPQRFATSCSLDSSGSISAVSRSWLEAAAIFAKDAPRLRPITTTFFMIRRLDETSVDSGIGRHTGAIRRFLALFAAAAFAARADMRVCVAGCALVGVRILPGDENN